MRRRTLDEAPFDEAIRQERREIRARGLTPDEQTAALKSASRRCRWCGTREIPPRRSSWCSDACVAEFTIRRGIGLRARVQARDKGVCAACGLDCVKMRRDLGPGTRYITPDRIADLERQGWTRRDFVRKSLWDADHILPVEHGGGACGLDNLQTLCRPCHRRKTAKQARERAAERRAARDSTAGMFEAAP